MQFDQPNVARPSGFYTYPGNVDLNKKLKNWEEFYNFNRPHCAFEGKPLYENQIAYLDLSEWIYQKLNYYTASGQ